MSGFRIAGASGRRLIGSVEVPGDKSIGHRAVLFAALGDGRGAVHGLSSGEDNLRTVAALRALGVAIVAEPGRLVVDGVGLHGLAAPSSPLDCGNSGTTLRLLAGVLAAQRFPSVLVGDRYLESRPMARIAGPLSAMGAAIEGRRRGRGELCAPLSIRPSDRPLHGIDFRSPTASAQVKSALLLAGLWADGPTSVTEPVRSRDHTERMLRALAAPITVAERRVVLDPAGWSSRLPARHVTVPGDLSSAAFLLGAAAVVPGSVVTVRRVGVNPTRTGVLDALLAMGVALTVENAGDVGGEPVADLTVRGGPLRGIEISGELAVRAIDELPLLAAIAAHADGATVIRDAAELRVKESDRIAAMAAALGALGVTVAERPDGLEIEGGRVAGGRVASRGDHRIAMAAAVAALGGVGDSLILDADNVATSFPSFAATLRALGAGLDVID